MDGAVPTIAVNWIPAGSKPLPVTAAVTSLVVDDHDRLIDEARVTLDDRHGLAANHFAAGQRVEIELGWEKDLTKVFEGRIERMEGAADATTLVVLDPAAAMHRNPTGEPLPPGLKLSAIVRLIADKYKTIPVGSIECDPDPTFEAPNIPHQVNVTDWAFLQSLAEVWGARCFVEVNDGRAQFYFKSIRSLWAAKRLATLSHCRGWGNVLSFQYDRIAAKAARQLAAVAFDPRTGQPVRSQGEAPPAIQPAGGSLRSDVAAADPGLAKANAVAAAAAAGAPPAGPETPLHLLGLPADPARAAALVVTDPTQVSGYRVCATVVGHVGLRAKGRVEIQGIAPWAEGDWWVRRATHCWTQARLGSEKPTASYVTKLEVTR